MIKKTVIIKVAYLIELQDEDGVLNRIMTRVGNDEKIPIDGQSFDLKWIATSSHTLDDANENCGKCSNCGAWTTDREKPNYIPELNDGATVEGKLLCDECLPSDHRWAF